MYFYIALLVIIVLCLILLAYSSRVLTRESFLDSGEYRPYSSAYVSPLYNLVPCDFNVYLINLARNRDRLLRFKKYYSQTDLSKVKDFIRIDAVDGSKINPRMYVSASGWSDIQDVTWYGYRTKHNQLTVGAVGCYLSHIHVYKQIRSSDANYGIVFEDDVRFIKQDVYRQIRNAISNLPSDWDMLLLGCVCHVCDKHPTYQELKHFFLLHAYIIKKSGAIKVLDHLEGKPIRQQIDSELSTLASNNKIKILCMNRWIVSQDNKENTTTIQTPMKFVKGVNPFEIPNT